MSADELHCSTPLSDLAESEYSATSGLFEFAEVAIPITTLEPTISSPIPTATQTDPLTFALIVTAPPGPLLHETFTPPMFTEPATARYVGAIVGVPVGSTDGPFVGARDGTKEGSAVGVSVGDSDGSADPTCAGSNVGVWDGAVLGV